MKCDIRKCKAECCYNVPFEKRYISAYRKKIVNPIIRYEEFGGSTIMPLTNTDLGKNKCPFLRDDCRCNIYEQRPQICRKFGYGATESKFLHCRYLYGEGEMTEQEKRGALAEMASVFNNVSKLKELQRELGINLDD